MTIGTIIRKAVSRCTWLRGRAWAPPAFPELEREWDFVRPASYYRVHRAWDPYLHGPDRPAAFAATDAPRALVHADSQADSDLLPDGYTFLTEFRANPSDKVFGDLRSASPDQTPQPQAPARPNGFALAGQLAKIEAFQGGALVHDQPYVLQTRHLCEVALDQAQHPITRRWVVRTTAAGPVPRGGDHLLVAALSAAEITAIENRFSLRAPTHPAAPPAPPHLRPPTLPTSYRSYRAATRIPELHAHPAEVLAYVLLLGLTATSALRALRRDCADHGFLAALNRFVADPRTHDPGVAVRNGLHAFRCLPELFTHLGAHERWLQRVAGEFHPEPAILALLDEMILIGVRPHPGELVPETEAIAFRFDNVATRDAFADYLPPGPGSGAGELAADPEPAAD